MHGLNYLTFKTVMGSINFAAGSSRFAHCCCIKYCYIYLCLYKIESLIYAIFSTNDLRNGKAHPYISYTID